jgi:hypothetical protein
MSCRIIICPECHSLPLLVCNKLKEGLCLNLDKHGTLDSPVSALSQKRSAAGLPISTHICTVLERRTEMIAAVPVFCEPAPAVWFAGALGQFEWSFKSSRLEAAILKGN